ncbi:MAG: hypothetical protein R6V44_11655 [Paracoccaceae bacterium]
MPAVVNFEPKTGVGRFDLRYRRGSLRVKVKLHVNEVGGSDSTEFQRRFGPMVKEWWETSYGFESDDDRVFPDFDIRYVDRMEDAHFVVNVMEGDGGSESIGRDVYYKMRDHDGFAPVTANLFTGSVQHVDTSGDLIRDLRASLPYYVDTPGGQLSRHAGEQLRVLGRQLKMADPNISLLVTGYGAQKSLSRQRVAQILWQCGITKIANRKSKKWFASNNPHTNTSDYVKVSLDVGLGAVDVSKLPLFSYPAAAVHEFGHMLGLQDEYHCLARQGADKLAELNFVRPEEKGFFEDFHPSTTGETADRPANGQAEYIIYCSRASVAPPHFGQHSVSIMSSGSEFRPCHFVTIWAALVEATGADDADWRIVPW